MAEQVIVGIRFKADGSGEFVGESAKLRAAVAGVGEASAQAGRQTTAAFRDVPAAAGVGARAMGTFRTSTEGVTWKLGELVTASRVGAAAIDGVRAASAAAEARMASAGGGIGLLARGLAMLGPAGIAAGVALALVGTAAGPMIGAFAEAERSLMRMEAQLKAAGNATGLFASDLAELADQVNDTTLFDDDAARDAIAALGQFNKVHGDTFREAIAVSADYAAATGRSLPAAAELLGRALQEPAEGLNALNRQLRLFDDEQERAIELMVAGGEADKARGLILDALKGRFAGIAAEMRGGIIGAAGELKKALGNLSEDVGERLAKALNIEGLLSKAAAAVNAARKMMAPATPEEELGKAEASRAAIAEQLARSNFRETSAEAQKLRLAMVEADKRIGQLREGVAAAKAADDQARAAQASGAKDRQNKGRVEEADALLKTLDPLSKQTEELQAQMALLKGIIDANLDPTGKYAAALEILGFRLGNVRDQVEQYLKSQKAAADLFNVPEGAARTRAQALQGVREAGEARGSKATGTEEAAALTIASRILAGQARDTAAALDIQTAGVLRLAEAQGKGVAGIREVEKSLKIEAEVLKLGAANRKVITEAVTREFEARKVLAAATFDAAQERRIEAAERLADAQLRGAAAVAEATLQNKIAEQVAAEGAEKDGERIAQIDARIRAEQRLNDTIAKRDETSRMRDDLALAQKELDLLGVSEQVRTRELALFQARLRMQQDGKVRTAEEIAQYEALAVQLGEIRLQTDRARESRDLWLEPFKNAIKSIQDAFGSMFEKIFSGGVTSFKDLGREVWSIMTKLAAQVATLLVFKAGVSGFGGAGGSSSGAGFDPASWLAEKAAGSAFDKINPFSGWMDSGGQFLSKAMPSVFGWTPTAYGSSIGIGSGVAAESMLTASAATSTAGPLAAMAPYAIPAIIAAVAAFSLFGGKASVGPNMNATVGMRDGRLGVIGSGADNGGDRGAAIKLAEGANTALEAVLKEFGGKLADGFAGLQIGVFKNKIFVDDTQMGGSARYDQNQFENEADAVTDFIMRALKSGKVDGLAPDVARALNATDAKTIEALQHDLTVARTFRDTVEAFNSGIGSMREQAIAFKNAAEEASKAEATRIETWLKDIDRLFGGTVTTTRDVTRRVSLQRDSFENGETLNASVDGRAYEVLREGIEEGGRRFLELRDAAGAVTKALWNAETRTYEFTEQVTETGPGGTSPDQEAARAAAKNRALSYIGLGPEIVEPLGGWSEAMAKAEAAIRSATPVLKAAGFTAEEAAAKIEEAWTKRLGELRDDYTEEAGRRLNNARGLGVLNSLDDLNTGLGKEHGDIGKLFSTVADQSAAANTANAIFEANVASALGGLSVTALQAVIDKFGGAIDAGSQAIARQAQAAIDAARATGNAAIRDQLAGVNDRTGAVGAGIALQRAQEERLRKGREDGLDMGAIERLNTAEANSLMQSWSSEQLAAWRDYLQSIGQLTESTLAWINQNAEKIAAREAANLQAAERQARLQVDAARWTMEQAASEKALADARATVVDLIGEEIQKTRDLAAAYARAGDGLNAYSKGLLLNRELSPLSTRDRLTEAESQFEAIAARAQAGDVEAMEELQGISQAYLEAARDYYASSADYYTRFQQVQRVLTNTETIAQREARIQEGQLSALERQLEQVTGINQGVKTLAEAMSAFTTAQQTNAGDRVRITGEQRSAWQRLASDFGRDYGAATTPEAKQAVYDRYAPTRDALLQSIGDVELLQEIGRTYYPGSQDAGANLLRQLIYGKGRTPGFASGGVAEGLFLMGERGPELAYAGAPTRIFDHDTTKKFLAGNDNSGGAAVVVAVNAGTGRVVDAILSLHQMTDARLSQVVRAIGDQRAATDRLSDQIRLIMSRAA